MEQEKPYEVINAANDSGKIFKARFETRDQALKFAQVIANVEKPSAANDNVVIIDENDKTATAVKGTVNKFKERIDRQFPDGWEETKLAA